MGTIKTKPTISQLKLALMVLHAKLQSPRRISASAVRPILSQHIKDVKVLRLFDGWFVINEESSHPEKKKGIDTVYLFKPPFKRTGVCLGLKVIDGQAIWINEKDLMKEYK